MYNTRCENAVKLLSAITEQFHLALMKAICCAVYDNLLVHWRMLIPFNHSPPCSVYLWILNIAGKTVTLRNAYYCTATQIKCILYACNVVK